MTAIALGLAFGGGLGALVGFIVGVVTGNFDRALTIGVGVGVGSGVGLTFSIVLAIMKQKAANECPHCGYSTRGLPSAICPECGMDYTEVEREDAEQ